METAPLNHVERTLACIVVLPNDQQFLARRSVVAWVNIAQAVVADIEAFDNTETERTGTLDDATTHITRPARIRLV